MPRPPTASPPRAPHEPARHDSRLRLVRRRAAGRQRLGRLRSARTRRTAAGAARCLSSAAGPTATTAVLIDTGAGLARAAARRRGAPARRRALHAMSMPTTRTASTICAPLVIAMRRRIDVYMDRRPTARTADGALRLLLRDAAGQRYPPILDDARLTAGAPVTIDGHGRRDRGGAVPPRARRHQCARLPLRRSRLLARRQRHSRRKRAAARRPRHAGSSTRCATRRIRAICLDEALAWIERMQAAPRDPDQHAHRSRLRDPACELPAGMSSRPMTA